MNKFGNPNFKNRWRHGKTCVIRIPECFETTLIYVAEKLDKQLISELDLQRMIEDYIETAIKGLSENKPFNHNEDETTNCVKSISIDNLIDSLTDSQKIEILKKILK